MSDPNQQQSLLDDDFDPLSPKAQDQECDKDSIDDGLGDKPASCGSAPASGGRPVLVCSYLEKIDPRVKDLVLWVDIKRSASVFSSLLVFLLACMCMSFISVVAYTALALLLVTGALRLYFTLVKKDSGDALENLMKPVSIPSECVGKCSTKAAAELECCINSLKKLLLAEDKLKTAKFFVGLVLLTYVGAWFNLLTLVTLAVVDLFTLPKVYSIYHAQVDQVLLMVVEQYKMVNGKIKQAIPFLREKDKAQ